MKSPKQVHLENLNKTFITSGRDKVVAVNDINLKIEPGEFATMLGPSGCGKTTTLRMIAGFEMPTSGNVYIGEENVANKTPDKRDTAMVFQNYALFPHMNVFDNIAYGLKILKRPKTEIKERVERILKMMKMEDFSERVPAQMSGGQQQRVSLARALVMEPGVLLFDEPLSNLDAKLRIHMRDEIRKIQQNVGITSIYVTHDQEEAMAMSDKVIIMNNGIIEQQGSPQEIYQRPINEFVANFIGRANILDGRIKGKNGDSVIVDIHGVEYSTTANKSFEAGQEVRVVIRPEGVIVGKNDFVVKVEKSVFMGQNHEYGVDFFGVGMEISENNPTGKTIYRIGDQMGIGFEARALHIL
ncbi:iron(III) transport system ATP-binding protein [Geosporobacter subterraneus DSM 17957]|uniref:Iron(III) transport system ATP-binding protein n=1 Tax=Geosporobacter subterraneus DSM 17957 TaxID=1121919 RepID=A0A1M6EDT0_9FIRM|nr:ABC transporter ATP-binding protein [Geosporobacter subterraneus]SHI83583.1 iron(III) transport system ATP-binding protein [Geosporobacter subterraneus DSM 17957]